MSALPPISTTATALPLSAPPPSAPLSPPPGRPPVPRLRRETRSISSRSPPPYPQDEAGIPAAAANVTAEVGEADDEDDEPPEDLLTEPNAENLFRRGVRSLQLAHDHINTLAHAKARLSITLAETELHRAFVLLDGDCEAERVRHVELVEELRRHVRLQRNRAEAAHQLRHNLEAMLHQAQIRQRRQDVELLDAAAAIQQLHADRDFAAHDAERWQREAEALQAELRRWQRMAVRLNLERAPEERYELPDLARQDEVEEAPPVVAEYDSDADTVVGEGAR